MANRVENGWIIIEQSRIKASAVTAFWYAPADGGYVPGELAVYLTGGNYLSVRDVTGDEFAALLDEALTLPAPLVDFPPSYVPIMGANSHG